MNLYFRLWPALVVVGVTLIGELVGHGQSVSLTGVYATDPGNGDIPDNDPNGITLNIGSPAVALLSVETIDVTIYHRWVGDLTIKVIPPGATEAQKFILFSEVDGGGAGANLGNVFTIPPTAHLYRFLPSGGFDFAAVATAAADDDEIPSGTSNKYVANTWQAGPFNAGQWQVFVSDSSEIDTGAIAGITVTGTAAPVPEPQQSAFAMALVVVGGAVFQMLRRPRKQPSV